MNIVILGPAGSGKGTQAEKLAEKFDLVHIDMGKTLRQAAKAEGPLGDEIHEIIYVQKGLVPSRIAKQVLHLKLGSIPREQGLIFEGVPRSVEQLGYIDETLLEFGRKLNKVFFINISLEEAIRRIEKRVVCSKCKATFILGKNLDKLDDPCPLCDGKVEKRLDDTEDGIKRRFEVFDGETRPVIDEYQKRGLLADIDGSQSPDEVFEDILEHLA